MHAALMEALPSSSLLVRQRSHLSASSSGRENLLRTPLGRSQRRPARTCCQQQEGQNGSDRIKQKFEKYPDGPTQMDTPVEAYRRDIVAGKVFDSLSLDSQDEPRG